MGDFFSSSNDSHANSATQSDTGPWSIQQPYLSSAFSNAQGVFNNQIGTPFYQGDLYARLNPAQLSAMSNLNSYAMNAGTTDANSLARTGMGALGGLSTGAGQFNSVFNRTQQDPTQQITSDAAQYANNPYVASMIKAMNQPIENQLNQVDLPNANINAAGTGNDNSSRVGTEEAILRQNAGNQESINAGNLEGQLYNTGVNNATNLYGTNLQGALTAANGAVNTGVAGANVLAQGYNTELNNLNVPLSTGTIQQQDQQAQDEAAYAQWQGSQNQPWNVLNNYMGVVGNRNWGASGTTYTDQTGKTTNNPSGAQDVTTVLGWLSDPRLKTTDDTTDFNVDQPVTGDASQGPTNDYSNIPGADQGGVLSFLSGLLKQNRAAPAPQAPQAPTFAPTPGNLAPPPPQQQQSGGSGGGGGTLMGAFGQGSAGGAALDFFSDPRMKVVDGNTHGALSAINNIDIKKARYKSDPPGTTRPMVMADQVQRVLPMAVTGRPGGPQAQTIKINELMPVLMGAIKELSAKVDRHARR